MTEGFMLAITPAPVRKSILVKAPPQRAFEVFTSGIGRWWPPSHHIGKAELQDAIIEPRAGGRWYERGVDGSECEWGRVLAWEPPQRVVLAWQLSADWEFDPSLVTEVEVRFTPEGEGTRVDRAPQPRALRRQGRPGARPDRLRWRLGPHPAEFRRRRGGVAGLRVRPVLWSGPTRPVRGSPQVEKSAMGIDGDGLRSATTQTIITPRHKLEVATIAQHLELLTDLLPYVPVVGIEVAQDALIGVNVVEPELVLSDCFDAFHHLDEPASCFDTFLSQEQRPPPLREHSFLGLNLTVSNNEDFSGLRDAVEQDVAACPACPTRSGSKRLSLLDDFMNEKVLWNHEKIGDAELLQVVVQQHQVGVVRCLHPLRHGAERTVNNFCAKSVFLTFELVFFAARRAIEIRRGTIGRELTYSSMSTAWAKHLAADPSLGPGSGALRRTFVSGSTFLETQSHSEIAAFTMRAIADEAAPRTDSPLLPHAT
jgi:uncharacterized protein YndB with AHSA1/START domain